MTKEYFMHELALAESLKDEIEIIAKRDNFSRIISVTLIVGELSGVDIEAMSFALPFVADGTVLEGAEFIYDKVKSKIKCKSCGKESCPEIPFVICKYCDSCDVEYIAGRDFIIKSLEVDDV
jgi:hydrogenase nickel incorporation protein HypA/HybF